MPFFLHTVKIAWLVLQHHWRKSMSTYMETHLDFCQMVSSLSLWKSNQLVKHILDTTHITNGQCVCVCVCVCVRERERESTNNGKLDDRPTKER